MHQHIGAIPPCDVFVHCGDILMIGRLFSLSNQELKLRQFNEWLSSIACPHKIVIGGNHDDLLERLDITAAAALLNNAIYLHNSECTVDGLRFWGSPVSGLKKHSHNRAFQRRHFKTLTHSQLPSGPVDVLVTHGHADEVRRSVNHKVHLWGHAHHSHGVYFPSQQVFHSVIDRLSICAALPGGSFALENLPIVLDFHRQPPSSTNLAITDADKQRTDVDNNSRKSECVGGSGRVDDGVTSNISQHAPVVVHGSKSYRMLKALWNGKSHKIAPELADAEVNR